LPAGFEGLRQIGAMMNGAFPDVVVTEDDLIASGDKGGDCNVGALQQIGVMPSAGAQR
jgi:hypothetical protein